VLSWFCLFYLYFSTLLSTGFITWAHAANRYCFWRRLSESVRLSVRTKSRKLIRNWCNLVGICPVMNHRSNPNLVKFDLDLGPWEHFCTFSIQTIYFEWLDLAALFSVWGYIFRISRGHLWVSRSRGFRKTAAERRFVLPSSRFDSISVLHNTFWLRFGPKW